MIDLKYFDTSPKEISEVVIRVFELRSNKTILNYFNNPSNKLKVAKRNFNKKAR